MDTSVDMSPSQQVSDLELWAIIHLLITAPGCCKCSQSQHVHAHALTPSPSHTRTQVLYEEENEGEDEPSTTEEAQQRLSFANGE